MIRRPPRSPLFPYTALFGSAAAARERARVGRAVGLAVVVGVPGGVLLVARERPAGVRAVVVGQRPRISTQGGRDVVRAARDRLARRAAVARRHVVAGQEAGA